MTADQTTPLPRVWPFQIYKSTGDLVAAKAMYDRYSRVSDDEDAATPWVKWRDIVIQRKQPKKMFVQANTFVKGEYWRLLLPYSRTPIEAWVSSKWS